MSNIMKSLVSAEILEGTMARIEKANLKSKLIISEVVLIPSGNQPIEHIEYANTPEQALKKLLPHINGNCMIFESVFLGGNKEAIALYIIKAGKVEMLDFYQKNVADCLENPQFTTDHRLCQFLQKTLFNTDSEVEESNTEAEVNSQTSQSTATVESTETAESKQTAKASKNSNGGFSRPSPGFELKVHSKSTNTFTTYKTESFEEMVELASTLVTEDDCGVINIIGSNGNMQWTRICQLGTCRGNPQIWGYGTEEYFASQFYDALKTLYPTVQLGNRW